MWYVGVNEVLFISRISVPVDFSSRCLRIIPFVRAIAEQYDTEVSLLHIVTSLYAVPPTPFLSPRTIPIPQSVLEESGLPSEFAQLSI